MTVHDDIEQVLFSEVEILSGIDRVAAEVSCHAELTTKKTYANQYHMLFRFDRGEITEVKEYNDTLHARETFGELR